MRLQKTMYSYVYAVIGDFLFTVDLNPFIVPLGLYNGRVIGIAQTIRTVLTQYTHIDFGQLGIADIINFSMNMPLLTLVYCSVSRELSMKALLCVLIQMAAFTIVIIPSTPILNDVLAVRLIDGLIYGFGTDLTLRSGGSGGGLDTLGVYFTKKLSDFNVERLFNVVSILVLSICVTLFNIAAAIYSIIYTACMYLVVGKTHYQNINMTAMIFTKEEEVQESIMEEMGRGVTYWKGAGAHTEIDMHTLITVTSKYEVVQLEEITYKIDPRVLIISDEGTNISRNFERRL